MRSALILLFMLCSLQARAANELWSQPLNLASPADNYVNHVEKLKSTKLLRGNFTQRRTIQVLKNPLVSTGQFVYFKPKGLLWELLTPFQSSYVISQENTRQLMKDNSKKAVQAPDKVMQGISKMFSAMFSGDFQHLQRYFDLYYTGQDSSWTIGLAANQSTVKKIIDKIELRGEKHIESIIIFESSGDFVEIVFENLNSQPETLTQLEADSFLHE